MHDDVATESDPADRVPLWHRPRTAYRAVAGRDARFDGVVYHGVVTTGIFCRPSCPARTPALRNLRFFPTAAAASAAGFRSCRRCRPDAVPGSPDWDVGADVTARAVRYVADGVVDREGVEGLAHRMGYGVRHLHRILRAELGAGPLALARSHRAVTARQLLATTDLSVTEVAYAAGFSSVRQCNETLRTFFDATPTELRSGAAGAASTAQPGIPVHLPARAPFDAAALMSFLARRAVPGLEQVDRSPDGRWRLRRALSLPYGHGVVEIWSPDPDHRHPAAVRTGVAARFRLEDVRDLQPAVRRVRRWLDLDADPVAVDEALGEDPALRPSVRAHPGRRVAGAVEPFDAVIRTVVGQQISVAAARTVTAALVQRHGEPLRIPDPDLTHVFPSPDALGMLDPALPPERSGLSMPRRRAGTVVAVSRAVADGEVDLGAGTDRERCVDSLTRIPGVGRWTTDLVRMRALGDPDVFLDGDLGVRRALEHLAPVDPDRWRPWRSYAVHHLWALDDEPRIEGAAPTARPASCDLGGTP